MKSLWLMGLAAFFLLVSACQREPIEEAIRGSLLPTEENVIVITHCRSCHVHAKFEEAPHIEKHRVRYEEESPLRAATQCLECHIVRPGTFFRGEERATIFAPGHGVLLDVANIPKPKPAGRLRRETGAGPAPKREPIPRAEKKKRRWYFLYLF